MMVVVNTEDLVNTGGGLYFGPYTDRRVAVFHINRKQRNLFLTLTDLTGAVAGAISTKMFIKDRKKRTAPHIIELVVKQLVLLMKAYRIFAIRLVFKISKSYINRAVVRALRSFDIRVTFCLSLVPTAHNGCRSKKRRRL